MKITSIAKFDKSLFSKDELVELQTFADFCVKANTANGIKEVGAELDQRRADHRGTMKELTAQSRSLNALYKRLIQEVPRRFGIELQKALKAREEEAK